jgi:hypothetical protein
MALQDFFVWGDGGQKKTPEQLARERKLAQAMIAAGVDTSPVGHWTQGAARLANALVGNLREARADKAEQAGIEGAAKKFAGLNLASLMGGGAAYPSAVAAGASPTSAAATNTPVSVPSAPEIRQGLVSRGLPEHVADAFLLNFKDESGLNPAINEKNPVVPGSRGGYGLYQLTGPRRTAYEQFAAQRGVDPSNVDAQLDFLMTELQGPEAKAAQSILSAPDTATAAQAIVNDFLRPAPEHRAARAARYARVGGGGTQVASLDPSIGTASQGGATFTADAYDPANYRGNAPANGARATIDDPMLTYDERGARMEPASYAPQGGNLADRIMDDPNARPLSDEERAVRLRKMEEIAPLIDGTVPGRPAVATTAAAAINQIAPRQSGTGMVAPQQPDPRAKISDALLRQHDMALGGALAGRGQAPQQVADASGYFPPAPSPTGPAMGSYAAIGAGGNLQQLLEAASDPWMNDTQRSVIGMALQKQMQQNDPLRVLQTQKLQLEMDALRDKPQTEYGFVTLPDGTVLRTDKRSGDAQPIYSAGQKPTSDIQEYNFAVSQGYKGTFAEYQQAMKRAGATNVTQNAAQDEGEFAKKAAARNVERFGALADAGTQAASVAQAIPVMRELLTQAPQGPVSGRLAEMFPGFSSAGDAFMAQVNQIAPTLRVPGSGALSDRDMDILMGSFPRLRGNPEANQMIMNIFERKAQLNAERGAIASAALRGEISPAEADRRIAEIDKLPLLDERTRSILTNSSGGERKGAAPQRINSKAEFDALPSGAEYIAPDGRLRRKP